jgi:hypothetical protein
MSIQKKKQVTAINSSTFMVPIIHCFQSRINSSNKQIKRRWRESPSLIFQGGRKRVRRRWWTALIGRNVRCPANVTLKLGSAAWSYRQACSGQWWHATAAGRGCSSAFSRSISACHSQIASHQGCWERVSDGWELEQCMSGTVMDFWIGQW